MGFLLLDLLRVLSHVNSTDIMFEFGGESDRALSQWIQTGNNTGSKDVPYSYELVELRVPTILKELLKSLAGQFRKEILVKEVAVSPMPSCEVVVREQAHSMREEFKREQIEMAHNQSQEPTLEQQEVIRLLLNELEYHYINDGPVALEVGISNETNEIYVYRMHFDLNKKPQELDEKLLFSKATDGRFFVMLNGSKTTSIHKAASIGKLKVVKSLVEKNRALIHSLDKDELTPLFDAVLAGHQEIVEYLLAQGSNIVKR